MKKHGLKKRLTISVGVITAAASIVGCSVTSHSANTYQPREVTVTSFDGTKIAATFYPADGLKLGQKAPTVLIGPGSGTTRRLAVQTSSEFAQIGKDPLLKNGYNVLAWDPRGFGDSGGQSYSNSANFEGKDVQKVIDWVAKQPEAQLDATNDPTIGMAGASYGGIIQLVVAGMDKRVDAITPTIAATDVNKAGFSNGKPLAVTAFLCGNDSSNSTVLPTLVSVLSFKRFTMPRQSDLMKQTCSALLKGEKLAPAAQAQMAITAQAEANITAPTLFIQGMPDVLTTIDSINSEEKVLADKGVPVSMMWFCGGHGLCRDPNPPARTQDAIISWFNKYLKKQDVPTVARFEYLDQYGNNYAANQYPLPAVKTLTSLPIAAQTLIKKPGLTSGGFAGGEVSKTGINVPIAIPESATRITIMGSPVFTMNYWGSVQPGQEIKTFVYVQLVDTGPKNADGIVVNGQVTAVPVILDGKNRRVKVEMNTISRVIGADAKLSVQIVPHSKVYSSDEVTANVHITKASVTVSVVNPGRLK